MKTRGIILTIIPYSESSLICKLLSSELGQISLIAKGIRKKEEPLLRLWEYELNLLEPKEEGLYLLKEARELTDYSTYPEVATWAAADSGAELLSQIIIPQPEAAVYYKLLTDYLSYLQKVDKNAVLILWRLFLRVFQLLGIGLELDLCSICHQRAPILAHTGTGELICGACKSRSSKQFSPLASEIIRLLPEIANHIQRLDLNRWVVGEINGFLLDYFYAHHKQTLKLKSLSVLSQFYPMPKRVQSY
jgi:DNA repair protein RecO